MRTISKLTTRDLDLLCRMPFFRCLSGESFHNLIRCGSMCDLAAGDALFFQGDEAVDFHVLLTGRLELYRLSADGDELVVRFADPEDAFASGATFSFSEHPWGARAIGAARVYTARRKLLLDRMHSEAAATADLVQSLSSHMSAMVGHIQAAHEPALKRLAAFLSQAGIAAQEGQNIQLPYKKQTIARAIGVEPETLSRLFYRLRRYGVQVHRAQLIVQDWGALRSFLDQSHDVTWANR